MSKVSKEQKIHMLVDFLVSSAQTELKFERIRRGELLEDESMHWENHDAIKKPAVNDQYIYAEFIPWAAKAPQEEIKELSYFDNDKNFIVRFFAQNGSEKCEIRIRNHHMCSHVAHKKAELLFRNQATFAGQFDEQGMIELSLPDESFRLEQIPFSFRILLKEK